MADIIVYQMGKVGSTSICRALERAGIAAAQPHFLGQAALVKVLTNLLEPDRTAVHVNDGIYQIDKNLRLTRLVDEHRTGRRAGPIKVITLTRDPFNWYVSFLVQNHAAYAPLIRDWAANNGAAGEQPYANQVAAFHDRMFSLLAEPPYATDDSRFEAAIEAARRNRPTRDRTVGELLLFLRVPTIWFKEFMVPVTGIDPIRDPGTADGPTLRFHGNGVELLLIPFERLRESMPQLARFAGLGRLDLLPAENVTAEKPEAAHYSCIRTVAEKHALAIARLYDSAYARRFGYRAPFGESVAGPARASGFGMLRRLAKRAGWIG